MYVARTFSRESSSTKSASEPKSNVPLDFSIRSSWAGCNVAASNASTTVHSTDAHKTLLLTKTTRVLEQRGSCRSAVKLLHTVYTHTWTYVHRRSILIPASPTDGGGGITNTSAIRTIRWHYASVLFSSGKVRMTECKCLKCSQNPTRSQFSLLHKPN